MTPATIIAYLPRPEAIKAMAQPSGTCACGLLRLGYLPEKKVGSVTHGFIACYKEGKP
jgi:hypothetical protein